MSAGHCVTGNGAFSIPDPSAANGKCPSISVKIYCPGIRQRKLPMQLRLVAMHGSPSVFHFSNQIILVRSGDPDFDKIAGHQVPSGLHKQCSVHTGSIHICA